ncbi:hypothetical protein [Roseovarius indicus]|nr:hypothetical protein [Roseovarius indicus]QEW25814.1 hypothetical protein RIdsm_01603 [Roseovarius indicus]SFD88796.1 hypothetical protein SAMN04488031_10317 [Roseovarius indicus]
MAKDTDKLDICLHLGAHKTATTYLQKRLDKNRDGLSEAGVQLFLPKDIRGKIGLKLPSPRQSDARNLQRCADTGQRLRRMIRNGVEDKPRAKRVIVSEENLIGSCKNNLILKGLYPDIAMRLSLLSELFNHSSVSVYFAVRAYSKFFSSNYTSALRNGTLLEKDEVAASLWPLSRSWVDVVTELKAALPRAKLMIWRYEDFGQTEPNILASLAAGTDLVSLDNRPLPTLSMDAVSWLERKIQHGSFQLAPGKVSRRAMARHPATATNPAFTLWSSEMTSELDERYEADWKEITSKWPSAIQLPN